MQKDLKNKYDLNPILNYGPVQGITVSVILDTRRGKENDIYPCKYRVTYLRKSIYSSCMNLSLGEFESLHGQVRNANMVKTKKLIQTGLDRITDTIEGILSKESFTLEKLLKQLSRGTEDSLFTAFDNRISELNIQGKIGSVVWYTSAKNSINKFAKRDIMLSQVTPDWLKRYEKHMLDNGNTVTTISINMRALRAIINAAKRNGIINESVYPFEVNKNGKYRIPEALGTKRALTEDQLIRVFNHPLLPRDEKYRDLWIFSFYCNGANISDILRFRYSNIVGNGIEWYRGKTFSTDPLKRKIRAIITVEMKDIIIRYGNPDKKPDNYVFPYLQKGLSPLQERMIIQNLIHCINERMTNIGKELSIGSITTYWSRHTWASLSRRKAVSLYSISKGLGHKTLTTTQIYLDSLPDDELFENASLLPRRIGK